MKLKIELNSHDLEALVRAEMARRFPLLRVEDLHVPYLGRDVTVTLDDEPLEPVQPPNDIEPLAADGINF